MPLSNEETSGVWRRGPPEAGAKLSCARSVMRSPRLVYSCYIRRSRRCPTTERRDVNLNAIGNRLRAHMEAIVGLLRRSPDCAVCRSAIGQPGPAIVPLMLMGLPLVPMTVSWPADTKLFVRGTTATRKGHSAQLDAPDRLRSVAAVWL